jgi:cellulose biosynthesis protein BcsQ
MSGERPAAVASVDRLAGVTSGDAMEQVSMNDGLDGRETVAFGLAAGEIAVFVLALMTGYAVLRSGLPGAAAWILAVVVVAVGAALAWGRIAGRPLLDWSLLLGRFVVRTRRRRLRRVRAAGAIRSAPLLGRVVRPRRDALLERLAQRPGGGSPRPGRSPETGALLIPLSRLRPEAGRGAASGPGREPLPGASARALTATAGAAAPAGARRSSHIVTFFSLKGGTGRTTLAVELAATLALRSRAAVATGAGPRPVALIDATERSPAVGLRLGVAPAPAPPGDTGPDAAASLHPHELGLLLGVPPAPPAPHHPPVTPLPAALIEAAEARGADVVVVDIDCDLGPRCLQVLRRCDQVLVTLTPTAGGVLDAYQSTAVLRRLGLRDRIGYVVNRWRGDVDLSDAMADLRGVIAAEVPDDHRVVDAENCHRVAGLDGDGPLENALTTLAAVVEAAARSERLPTAAARWGNHAG